MSRATDFFLCDEAGLLEDAKVFHDRGQGHAIGLGKLADGGFAEHQGGQNGAACGVGESAEGRIEPLVILNHMV